MLLLSFILLDSFKNFTSFRLLRGKPSGRLALPVLISQISFVVFFTVAISQGFHADLSRQLQDKIVQVESGCADPLAECLRQADPAVFFGASQVYVEESSEQSGHSSQSGSAISITSGAAPDKEPGYFSKLASFPEITFDYVHPAGAPYKQRVVSLEAGHLEVYWHTFLAAIATAAMIASLICIELSVLASARARRHEKAISAEVGAADYRLMRPAIFVFLFGVDLSMAFIPLYTESLFEPMFGLSRDVVMGLPISFEFLCVGIAILVAGAWFDRRGWQEPFYVGLVLAGIGGICSWLASDALEFILSRGLVGFGYGLAQLSSHGFVIKNTDDKTKAQGLSHLAAGLYSGSICGAAAGAVMADYFDYEVVFAVSAVTIFSVLLYGFVCLGPKPVSKQEHSGAVAVSAGTERGALWSYLKDRGVLAAIFFSSMPASIAVVGYLNYFSPVYLNRIDISESTIGQVLMLFGICLSLAGPYLGKVIDATENKKAVIVVGSLIGSASFLSFAVWDGLPAVVLAVLLLGVSNCLVLSAQSVYVLNRPVSKRLGSGKALAIFRSTSRIGQMLGPIIFAWIILSDQPVVGVFYFGVAYFLAAVMFLVVAGKDRESMTLATES